MSTDANRLLSESADERAERLLAVAIELAERVRDYGADDNAIWLAHALPDPSDREALNYVLAALVPLDRSVRQLTAWLSGPPHLVAVDDRLEPCGTRAAYRRHKDHGEEVDEPCEAANAAWERARSRDRRQRQRAAVA